MFKSKKIDTSVSVLSCLEVTTNEKCHLQKYTNSNNLTCSHGELNASYNCYLERRHYHICPFCSNVRYHRPVNYRAFCCPSPSARSSFYSSSFVGSKYYLQKTTGKTLSLRCTIRNAVSSVFNSSCTRTFIKTIPRRSG